MSVQLPLTFKPLTKATVRKNLNDAEKELAEINYRLRTHKLTKQDYRKIHMQVFVKVRVYRALLETAAD
jgi:hypothetical protein